MPTRILSNDLEAFHQRRKVATTAMAVATWEQSFLLGSSVVVGSLLTRFTPSGETFQFHGLYAVTLALFVSYVLGSDVIIPLFQARPESRKMVTAVLSMLFPLAFILGGVSVAANDSVALLYVGFSVVMGASLSFYDVFTRCESLLWWGPDGKKNVGISILGSFAGLGSIFYSKFEVETLNMWKLERSHELTCVASLPFAALVSGWTIVYGSLATCLYTLAGIQFLLSLYLAVSVLLTGRLDSPPTVDDVMRWTADHAASDMERSEPSTSSNDNSVTSEDPADEVSMPVDAVPLRSPGTTHLVPVQLQSRREALRYPAVVLKLIQLATITFNGYATKVLLSSMFELTFALPKLTAAYLSALSLVLFLVGRALIPYYLLDSRYSSTLISTVAAFVSAIAYGVLPSIVGKEELGPEFTWRLFGFVCIKSLIGLCFSCLQVLSAAQMYDLAGGDNLQTFLRLGWPVVGVCGTAGPIVAFTTAQARFYSGMAYSQAFSLFFYIAAGLAFLNMLVNIALHLMLHRNTRKLEPVQSSTTS